MYRESPPRASGKQKEKPAGAGAGLRRWSPGTACQMKESLHPVWSFGDKWGATVCTHRSANTGGVSRVAGNLAGGDIITETAKPRQCPAQPMVLVASLVDTARGVLHGLSVPLACPGPGQSSAPTLSRCPGHSPQLSLGGHFLCFADGAPILCSESMCSKDKLQENSCCLLTLTIRIVGQWRKQEMTNGFSDQEETGAENCCLVSGHSISALVKDGPGHVAFYKNQRRS